MVILVLATVSGHAQNHKKEHRKEIRKERINKMMDRNPEALATQQTQRMATALELTEAQQKQVQAITLEVAKERQAKMKALKKRKDDGNDEKLSKEARLKFMNERKAYQTAMKQKMKAVLTETQYNKWEANIAKREAKKEKIRAHIKNKNRQ